MIPRWWIEEAAARRRQEQLLQDSITCPNCGHKVGDEELDECDACGKGICPECMICYDKACLCSMDCQIDCVAAEADRIYEEHK